jgi:hypothetical protein
LIARANHPSLTKEKLIEFIQIRDTSLEDWRIEFTKKAYGFTNTVTLQIFQQMLLHVDGRIDHNNKMIEIVGKHDRYNHLHDAQLEQLLMNFE